MKVVKIEELHGTKWLSFKTADYISKDGNKLRWDYISRKGDRQVVTCICRSKRDRYLFVAQPRVPLNKIVVEFPAGLVDPGESFEEAAQRELKEETGYEGIIKKVIPPVAKSAGLTDETTAIVIMEVDEKAVGKTEMEESEDIQHFWMSPSKMLNFIDSLDSKKIVVDTLVSSYFLGWKSRKK